MLAALLRYPHRERRAVAQRWARRAHEAQAIARLARSPDADTLRRRTLHDARGEVVREGVTYHGDGRVTAWCVRRAIFGRTDQFEIVVSGRIWCCGGYRRIKSFFACNVTKNKASQSTP